MAVATSAEARFGFRVLAGILGAFAIASVIIACVMIFDEPSDKRTPITVVIVCGRFALPCWKLALTGRLFASRR